MLAVRGAKAAKTARYVKNVTNLIGNGVTFLRSTGEAISGAIDVVSNYIETGEMDWGGLGAVGLNSITAAMSGKAALSSGNALRKALSEDNVAGKIKNSLGNAAGRAKSGVKAFLADNGGYLNLSGKRPDFYVKPNGDAVPATGYRYISEDASYLDVLESSMEIPSNSKGTYFSYNNYDIANPEALQVPHDASIKVSFDTLQIIDDISIPYGKWGQSKSLEPITKDFPEFGLGGATQVITHSNIKVDSITRLPKRQGGTLMYKPTEIEKKVCRDVVKDILGNSNDLEYEKYIEEILSLTYSIGGDYSKTTISSVAKVVLKDVL